MSKVKGKAKKYYAIKKGNGVTNKIVASWEECKELVHGYKSMYKSFPTLEEANEYLEKKIDVEKEIERTNKAISNSKQIKKDSIAISNLFKGVRIKRNIAEAFKNKCDSENYDAEKILNALLEEWSL